jgi:hypothetical protein
MTPDQMMARVARLPAQEAHVIPYAVRTVVVGLSLGAVPAGLAAQPPQPPSRVVYVIQRQVPWERTDSLVKLLALYPAWTATAQREGHIVDRNVLVHLQGDEWNVVVMTVFASWDAWANQKPGWGQSVLRMVEPDSARRAAFNTGMNWVYQGTVHRDNVYRLVRP